MQRSADRTSIICELTKNGRLNFYAMVQTYVFAYHEKGRAGIMKTEKKKNSTEYLKDLGEIRERERGRGEGGGMMQ